MKTLRALLLILCVSGAAVAQNPNLGSSPAAPGGGVNIVWQYSGTNVSGYIPTGNYDANGAAAAALSSANSFSANAANITSGSLPLARLPNNGVTPINGVNCTIGTACTPPAPYAGANGSGGRFIYKQSYFTSLSGFTQVGSLFSVASNQILVGNGAGTFANYLSINGTNNDDPWVDFIVTFQVNAAPTGTYCSSSGAAPYGIAIGKLGNAEETTNTAVAFLQNASSGSPVAAFVNGSQVGSSSTGAGCVAVGDQVQLTYSQRHNKITVIADNLTQNLHESVVISDSLTTTQAYVQPNSSVFAIWSLGGSYTIENIAIISRQPPHPYIRLSGDSKLYGFMAGASSQTPRELLAAYGPVANYSGQAETTVDWLANLPYALTGAGTYAINCIGYNDIGFGNVPGGLSASEANYRAGVLLEKAAGEKVIHMLSIPSNAGVNMATWNAFITSTYGPSGLNDIIVDPSVGFNISTMLVSDNVHPNPLGWAQVVSQIISQSGIPLPTNSPAYFIPPSSFTFAPN